jgi:hypothetical protein
MKPWYDSAVLFIVLSQGSVQGSCGSRGGPAKIACVKGKLQALRQNGSLHLNGLNEMALVEQLKVGHCNL